MNALISIAVGFVLGIILGFSFGYDHAKKKCRPRQAVDLGVSFGPAVNTNQKDKTNEKRND